MPRVHHKKHSVRSRSRRRALGATALIALAAALWVGAAALLSHRITPDAHVARAVALEQAGDVDAALAEIRRALRKDSEHADARWRLAQYSVASGDGAAALAVLDKLGAAYPESAADLMRVRALLLLGRYREALDVTDRRPPDSAAGLQLRGEAQVALGAFGDAAGSFSQALGLNPASLDAKIGLARVALAGGSADEAERMLTEILAIDGAHTGALVLLGKLQSQKQNFAAAQAAFERAVNRQPDHLEANVGLANAYLAQGRRQFAEERLAGLPQVAAVLYLRGVAAQESGDFQRAKPFFDAALSQSPEDYGSLVHLGEISFLQGNHNTAEHYLMRAIASGEANLEAWLALADVQRALGRPTDAAATLRQALERYPGNPEAVRELALPQGDPDESAPEQAAARMAAADRAQNAGDVARAIAEYEQLVDDDTHGRAALTKLAMLYRDSRDPRALETAERVWRLAPDDVQAAGMYGALLLQAGRPADGLEAIDAALRGLPGHAQLVFYRALALAQLGRTDAARQAVAPLLELESTDPVAAAARELIEQLNAANPPSDA